VVDNQLLLNDVVNLYRLCGKPDFADDTSVHCEIVCSQEDILLINNIHHKKDDIIELVRSNESHISLPLQPSVNGQTVKFTLNAPLIDGYKRFFKNVDDLISNHTGVKKGILPESFYLLENDYLAGEENEPEQLQQLKQVCRWINFLKKALPHTEEKKDSYLFVLLTEDKESKGFKKHLIESRFTVGELRNLDGLESFEEMLTNTDLHCFERLSVVRNALEELLSKKPATNQRLGDILFKFDIFKQLYQDNYETYINGFSLKDFKKEVVAKHEEFASKIESSINDVINKGLAIPVSFAAIGAFVKEDQLINSLFVSLAVLVTSIFMWRLSNQYKSRLTDIKSALDEVFEKFQNREEKAAKFVNEKKDNLKKRANSLSRDLEIFSWLSWLPTFSAIILLCVKYPQILKYLHFLICSI
jgi:hypothetical protein